MIFFVAPVGQTWCTEEYLQQYGGPLLDRVRILTYDHISTQKELPIGTYIFLAIDQLFPIERGIALRCWRALSEASSDITLINHPTDALCRYDLLKVCYELKRNTFQVHRASGFYRLQRFPVFIRSEREHGGSLTPLLHNQRHLTCALTKILLLGYRLRDLIIVEYCDTMDSSGIFRLYCDAIIGDRIIPVALIHNRNWITKWEGRLVDEERAREQREYVESNPHAEWVRETFSLAKIRYGQINYGLKDGAPQVWEINTNPTVVRQAADPNPMPEEQKNLIRPVREAFLRQYHAALEAIDSETNPTQMIRIDVSRAELRRLEAEKRLRLRLQAHKTVIGRTAYVPILLWRHLRGK